MPSNPANRVEELSFRFPIEASGKTIALWRQVTEARDVMSMKNLSNFPAVCLLGFMMLSGTAFAVEYPLRAAPLGSVTIEGGFWGPRITTLSSVTLPHNFSMLESTGRLANFDRAAGIDASPHVGDDASDSDVFKVLEGAAHTLKLRPGEVDEAEVARMVARVIAAQQKDGFLNTKLDGADKDKRWDDRPSSHLLYSAGHLFEAGVAWRDATGRTDLLDASVRFADLIDQRYGKGKIHQVPGHQEIELALIKLYQATGERRYLDLSSFFLEQRGHIHGGTERVRGLKPRLADYNQDRIPLKETDCAVGHAVRAGYTYAAMADISALGRDMPYNRQLERIWQDVVGSKLYITGGSATAQFYDEGFGDPYHLPNDTAYCETCGTIATVLWCHRMALLHRQADYFDVLERALYNGVLSGISISGDRFFYTNRLANRGADQRPPSWEPPCCQTNLVRIIPQVASMAYSTWDSGIQVNLFVNGKASLDVGGETVIFKVETNYPDDGRVKITIEKSIEKQFYIALRIPGWAREKPVPGDLYRFASANKAKPWFSSGGKEHDVSKVLPDNGYKSLAKKWKAGDVIELDLPMPVRRVLANDRVAANQGRVALQRGPLVYCIEAIDNGGLRTDAIVLPDDAELAVARKEVLLGGAVVVTGNALAAFEPSWGTETEFRHHNLVAIPYHAWANRGGGYMDIWLPRTAAAVTPIPAVTAAGSAKISASGTTTDAKLTALNDGRYGQLSETRATPRFTFSEQRDGTQWVQYEWPQPRKLSRTALCWAVDRREQVYWGERIRGEDLVLPKSWRVLYQDGGQWLPVETEDPYTLRLDDPNEIRFTPVTTQAVRIEVEPAAVPSAIHEWWID